MFNPRFQSLSQRLLIVATVVGILFSLNGTPVWAKGRSKNAQILRKQLVAPRSAVSTDWTVPALAKAYNFPTGLPGGAVIGIAEFTDGQGGYDPNDMLAFSQLYMNGTPINIIDVSVDGTVNDPTNPDLETTLDIQIAAAAYYYCTGKAPTIKVFFSASEAGGGSIVFPPSQAGDFDPFAIAIKNAVNTAAAAKVDLLSISYGVREEYIKAATLQSLDQAVSKAAQSGMPTLVSSGDYDSPDARYIPANGFPPPR